MGRIGIRSSKILALFILLFMTLPPDTAALNRTAPPDVLDTSNQRGALIDPSAPLHPNWPHANSRDIPASLDWSDIDGESFVSGVRNQWGCGSCWDFAAVAMLEAQSMIRNQQPDTDPDFSEQYVLSCIHDPNDCQGGYASHACTFLHTEGTPNDSCLEYEGIDTIPCSDACEDVNDQLHRMSPWSYVTTSYYDVEAIKQALQWGPVLTWMRIHDDFSQLDDWTIYTGEGSTYTGWNHFVLITGYDDANQCWHVKNSYGTSFGRDGYFRIAYENACWFGLYTIAGYYEPPATSIELGLTLDDMQETYSDYEVEVRVFSDGGDLLTYVPFTVTSSRGRVREADGDTGESGIGHAVIRTEFSGMAVVAASALHQHESVMTYFVVGPADALEPVAAIPETGDLEAAAVTWSPDGNTLAVAYLDGSDGLVQFIDVDTWQVTSEIEHDSRACGLAYNPDGDKIVVAFSNEIMIYNALTGQLLDGTDDVDGNPGDSRSTIWPLADTIITPEITSGDDALCVLSSALSVLQTFTVGSFGSAGVSVSGGFIHLSTGSGPDQVQCYHLSNFSHLHTFNINNPISGAANPAGTRLAITRSDDDIGIYDTSSWELVSTITGLFTDEQAFMSWSPDASTIAGIDRDDSMWVFDYDSSNDTGQVLASRHVGGNGSEGMVAWHPGGATLAVSTPGNGVFLFTPRDEFDPTLSVEHPNDGAIINEETVLVGGTATDQAGMRVVVVSNGDWQDKDFDLDDGFAIDVPLQGGDNEIIIRGVDNSLRSTEMVLHVHRTVTSVHDSGEPILFRGYPPAPNPANPGTVLAYDLPDQRRVTLGIYDVSGRVVRHLIQGEMQSQGHQQAYWDGRDDHHSSVSSGVYFCRVTAGKDQAIQRFCLVK